MNPMQFVPVPPAIAAKTTMYNITYRGNVVHRNMPIRMAYATKNKMIASGSYQGRYIEIKQAI